MPYCDGHKAYTDDESGAYISRCCCGADYICSACLETMSLKDYVEKCVV